MKRKRFAALIISVLMVISLCACGGSKVDENVGKYEMYAYEEDDYILLASDLDMSGYMDLQDQGAVVFFADDETMTGTWSADGAKLSVTIDGDTADGTIENGIIKLEFDGVYVYFVSDKADTSSIHTISIEEALSDMFGEMIDDEDIPTVVKKPGGTLTGNLKGNIGEYYVEITGAENSVSYEGEPVVRVYYDFTNNSSKTVTPGTALDVLAYQDGAQLEYRSGVDTVEEYWNHMLGVRPGVTIRCADEFAYSEEGGDIHFKVTEWLGDNDDCLEGVSGSDAFIGAPASALEIKPITDPTWTDEMEWEGDMDGVYVLIDSAETDYGYDDEELFRFYVVITNNTDEEFNANGLFYSAYQDGIEMEIGLPAESVESDDAIYENIQPGETLTVSYVYTMRSDSPVEVEVSDLFEEYVLGGVFE